MMRCPTCGALYSDDAQFCTSDGSPLEAVAFAPSLLLGTVLAERYEILKIARETPQGAVLLGKHIELDRQYVVEVMHTADVDLLERFRRGAVSAARVRHRNVVQVQDFGSTLDGLRYCVTELFQGLSLREMLNAERTLKTDEVVSIVIQLGRALHAVHKAGVVHRDVKPDNVVVGLLEDANVVKLTGFDVAVTDAALQAERITPGITSEAFVVGPRITSEAFVVGTPQYMSPEQFVGEPLDPRSDVYSFGLLVYELVAGRLPFDPESEQSVIDRLTKRPPRLRDVMQTPVPAKLQDALDRALARSPADRYERAIDLATDVVEALKETPGVVASTPRVASASAATQLLHTAASEEVFISYAREDEAFALALARALRDRGVPVWIDKLRILAGVNWDRAIDEALERCARLVVVLSSSAVASEQVQSEWHAALEQAKTVVPVVSERCRIPRQLRLLQHVELTPDDLQSDGALEPLLRAVGCA